MIGPKKQYRGANKPVDAQRIIDLLERIAVLDLYFNFNLGHHAIARKLGMGTQRVTAVLKGLKRLPQK